MHCLLQKLQEELDDKIRVRLFKPLPCSSGGEVVVYPGLVRKVVIPPLDQANVKFMYDSIAGSRYLIQLKGVWSTGKNTTMQLEPVGDPHARPVVLRDLENAIHDMLHSLVDLHKAGYTHRDLRWENCIKVNVEDEWKWVIIDLEAAGHDGEEWEGDGLTAWDESMLEDCNGKKIYTNASDMYQLGKLIVEATYSGYGEEDQDLYALGEKMQWECPAAMMMLAEICKGGCE
jgi:hypothetical protein